MTMTEISLLGVLEEYLSSLAPSDLYQAREDLSCKYRVGGLTSYIQSHHERLSYLATRMPATFAVLNKVFRLVCENRSFVIKSLLDLGSGPGTTLWAVSECFPELSSAILMERDKELIEIGKQLIRHHLTPKLLCQEWQWVEGDMTLMSPFPAADLVVLSYSVGELSPLNLNEVVKKGFEAAQELFIVIEPGTPSGFKRIAVIRDLVLSLGGFLVAPCPHAEKCPISENDWCHFSIRLNRSRFHKVVKQSVLGYEDEKFSFVAFSKKRQKLPCARVIRHPEVHSGHVELTLCSDGKIEETIISRKMKDKYRAAKKLEWGDSWF